MLIYVLIKCCLFWWECNSKSDLKLTRTRIEMIKKKRNAVQKYLRNDVADLLRNGLDTNAYGRVTFLFLFYFLQNLLCIFINLSKFWFRNLKILWFMNPRQFRNLIHKSSWAKILRIFLKKCGHIIFEFFKENRRSSESGEKNKKVWRFLCKM